MGSFGGHALPGSFFVLFALWHSFMLSLRYFQSRRRNGPAFKAVTYYPAQCCWKFPLESFLKLFSCGVGIAGEVLTGFNHRWEFVGLSHFQHITMFSFFAFCGLVEMLHCFRFRLPPNSTHVANILAFSMEGIMFHFHLHGRTGMDTQVHQLLEIVIFATVVTVWIEMRHKNWVVPALCRCYLILLQGFWFWQVAFILYPPKGMAKWEEESHEQMMLVTAIFAADAALSMLVFLAVWFLVARSFGNCRRRKHEHEGFSPLKSTE